jgi:acyl-CoA synthetase (NDP forming)
MLRPASTAIVGARDDARTISLADRLGAAGIEVFLVNPSRTEIAGRPVFPRLTDIGAPIDAVLSMVNAEVSLAVARDAVAARVGGLVIGAAGFAEVGGRGTQLQAELALMAKTGGLPVVGPNCLGFINARAGAWISLTPDFPIRPGALSVVSHSGALLRPTMSAANQRRLGVGLLISAGNEAVTDMTDYIDFLADDPETRVIGLIVEMVRRPAAFFAAVDRAVAGGKAVVCLRLARGERAQAVARSHTGSLVANGGAYDVAFRQHGVILANDLDELLDRASLLAQVPAERWTPVHGLGVITASGGGAGLISDLSDAEGVPLPELKALLEPLDLVIPGIATANPLDMTGFSVGNPASVDAVFAAFAASAEIDADLVVWGVSDHDEAFGQTVIDGLLRHAARTDRLHILSAVEASRPGDWTGRLSAAGIAVGHGLRGTLRGLAAMRAAQRASVRQGGRRHLRVEPLPPPEAQPIDVTEGAMLPFADAMRLLREAGVPIAPFRVIGADDALDGLPFDGPYTVKLADVAHRTDIGAVRRAVPAEHVAATVADLRELAERRGLARSVVVQPHLSSGGEAFVGVEMTDLGPLVVFGLGGVMVELLRKTAMRVAPFDAQEAEELLDELGLPELFRGFRGQAAWNRPELTSLLVNVSHFATASAGWLSSLDVNPLILSSEGFVAVDCLCLVRKF